MKKIIKKRLRLSIECIAACVMLYGCENTKAHISDQDSVEVIESEDKGTTDNIGVEEITGTDETSSQESEATESKATESKEPSVTGSEEAEEQAKADWETFDSVLMDIYYAMPGVSGCSLKSAKAAAELLDWSEDNVAFTDEETIQEKANIWMNENKDNLAEIEDIVNAWQSVSSNVELIINDDESIDGILSDAGYTRHHESYTESYYKVITDALNQVFQSNEAE